jgi:predicted transcriptional regulator
MNQGSRKYPAIDVMKFYATMPQEKWRTMIQDAGINGKSEKLLAWRYGLQAGLADANASGKITTEKIDAWVLGRIREVEKAMKYIARKRHPSPLDGGRLAKSVDDVNKAREAKRKRDREFERFLNRSNF